MLKRKMMEYLKSWRAEKDQECLLIKGARQVGKSFIIEEFGRSNYESYISIDFIRQPQLKSIFQGDLTADSIYRSITLLIPGVQFVEGSTLIFLDEIQECPEARTALKYLAIDNRFDVIASGSLLGVICKEDRSSVPVGYERQIEMHPLDFEEYLWARGYGEDQISVLRSCFDNIEPVSPVAHAALMRHLREYIAIGGMPAVVQSFIESDNFGTAHAEQSKVMESYLDDIARYASAPERVKARACYLSLPRQLAKENTKFQYSVVEKRGSARKFDGSVDWLENARTVLRCRSVTTPTFPLASYEAEDKFRLYANDTGLLMAMFGFEMMAAVVENTLAGPMKGGLYENLIASMLIKSGHHLRYWISQNASQEIEFFVEKNGGVVPVEVKAKRGTTASLNEQLARDDVSLGYKLIDGNVGKVGKKVTLPLYMAMFL